MGLTSWCSHAAVGKLLRTLEGHKNTVNSVEWSKDGRTLVSGSDDHSIILWDAATGKPFRSLLGHEYHVEAVTWSPDGKLLPPRVTIRSGYGSAIPADILIAPQEVGIWE